jgi:hypothetical protein
MPVILVVLFCVIVVDCAPPIPTNDWKLVPAWAGAAAPMMAAAATARSPLLIPHLLHFDQSVWRLELRKVSPYGEACSTCPELRIPVCPMPAQLRVPICPMVLVFDPPRCADPAELFVADDVFPPCPITELLIVAELNVPNWVVVALFVEPNCRTAETLDVLPDCRT